MPLFLTFDAQSRKFVHLILCFFFGGVGRDRTGYLLTASQTLSRLSYDPRRNRTGKGRRGAVVQAGNPRGSARSVERRGLEPRSLPCEGSVLPVELSPRWQAVKESNPLAGVLEAPRSP